MIRLRRGAKPRILVRKEVEWTEEYRKLRAGETVPRAAATRYRHKEIKGAVKRDSRDKCIYCESLPLSVSPGDVEHIAPKSLFPERVVDWENLAFVCPVCNTTKGDYWDELEPIVNPYEEDPSAFIRFAGPMVLEQPGNARGITTISRVGLDRPALFERRMERVRALQRLMNAWALLPPGPAKDEVREQLRREADEAKEFAGMVRDFLALTGI